MTAASLSKGMARRAAAIGLVLACVTGTACSSAKPREPYRYVYSEGRTARITADGYAVAPPGAPAAVKRAIQAGNEICKKPYRRGGGHARLHDTAYDCSGSTCYVLNKAGLMKGSMPSGPFRKFGKRGEGRWISVYSRDGHVFLVVAGLRFDTSSGGSGHVGPRWLTKGRSTHKFVVRHPPGF
jgi:hypothetical protein